MPTDSPDRVPDPSSDQPAEQDQIAAAIRAYRPVALSDQHWATVSVWLCALVIASEPVNAVDARQTLATGTKYLHWTARELGTVDPDLVMDTETVDRFAARHRGGAGDNTLSRDIGRLRRLMRVRAGEPSRTQRHTRGPGVRPYTDAEVTVLNDGAQRGSGNLAFALALGFGAGVVPPKATGVLVADFGRCLELADGRRLAIAGDETHRLLAIRTDCAFTSTMWDEARHEAAGLGIDLRADRLHATWRLQILSASLPLAGLARMHRLTRADFDNCLAYLPAHTPADANRLLRG